MTTSANNPLSGPDRSALRLRLAVVAGPFLLLLAVLAAPAFTGRIHLLNDLGDQTLPWRTFMAERAAAGELVTIHPGVQGGFFLAGDAWGFWHPALLAAYRFLPLPVAIHLEFLAAPPLLALGAFFWLRRRGLPPDAGALGACALGGGAFLLRRLVHPVIALPLAHLPWILCLQEVALTDSRPAARRLAAAGLALLMASQLLAGHPQIFWFGLCLQAVAAAVFLRRGGAGLPLWFCGLGLGLLLAAPQILAAVDSAAVSRRGAPGAEWAGSYSLPPAQLAQLLLPHLYDGHEYLVSGGAVLLLLALRGLLGPGEARFRPLVGLGAGLAVFGLVFALGRFSAASDLLARIPFVSMFRCPCRYLFFWQAGLALLAAVGVAGLASASGGASRRSALALGAVVVASVCAALLVGALRSPALAVLDRFAPSLGGPLGDSDSLRKLAAAPGWMLALGPVLFLGAAGLILRAERGGRRALIAVLALALVEQGVDGVAYLRSVPPGLPAAALEVLPPPPADGARIMIEETTGNRLLLAGRRLWSGYVNLYPARKLDGWQGPSLRAAGVGWLRYKPPGKVAEWVPIPAPAPRLRLADRAVADPEPAAALGRIDPVREAVVDRPIELDPGGGTVEWLCDEPTRKRIRAEADGRRLLVLADTWYADWRGMLDGRPVEILRVNGDLMGVALPPGRHEVTLEFSPRAFREGVWYGLAGAIGLLGLCLAALAGRGGRSADPAAISPRRTG